MTAAATPPPDLDHVAWIEAARIGVVCSLDGSINPSLTAAQRAGNVDRWSRELERRSTTEAWTEEVQRRAEVFAAREREQLERDERRLAALQRLEEAAEVRRKTFYLWKPDHCTVCRQIIHEGCRCERSPWSGSLEVRVNYRVTSPRDSEDRMLRARRRRDERRAMAKALHPHLPPDVAGKPHGSVLVTFARYGMRPLDDDALAYAYKSFRDQCAVWMRVKDAPTDPPAWRYEQAQHVTKVPDTRRGRRGHVRYEVFTIVRIKEGI